MDGRVLDDGLCLVFVLVVVFVVDVNVSKASLCI